LDSGWDLATPKGLIDAGFPLPEIHVLKTLKCYDEEFLTAEELAPKLKVQTDTIYRLVRSDAIPHTRINHKILRFRLSEVQKALAEHYHVPAKPMARRPFPKRKLESK
jgi:excisionase family DNA binding protein